ncbi:MAG: hypothetical protein H6718_27655 [Polyangiaceae bacterium]|nr:hypothetical protein [Myxococcales bacterium]MCB9589221.1 hypothetical protein [Polyangiaceae bacterium]
MAHAPQVTDAYWPIIVMTLTDGMDYDAYSALFEGYERIMQSAVTRAAASNERAGMNITLSDLSVVRSRPAAKTRALAAQKSQEWQPLMRRFSLGDVRVVTSSLVRGAMTAVSWIYQHPLPLKYSASFPDGVNWCVQQLDLAGVPLSDGTRQLMRMHGVRGA